MYGKLKIVYNILIIFDGFFLKHFSKTIKQPNLRLKVYKKLTKYSKQKKTINSWTDFNMTPGRLTCHEHIHIRYINK